MCIDAPYASNAHTSISQISVHRTELYHLVAAELQVSKVQLILCMDFVINKVMQQAYTCNQLLLGYRKIHLYVHLLDVVLPVSLYPHSLRSSIISLSFAPSNTGVAIFKPFALAAKPRCTSKYLSNIHTRRYAKWVKHYLQWLTIIHEWHIFFITSNNFKTPGGSSSFFFSAKFFYIYYDTSFAMWHRMYSYFLSFFTKDSS